MTVAIILFTQLQRDRRTHTHSFYSFIGLSNISELLDGEESTYHRFFKQKSSSSLPREYPVLIEWESELFRWEEREMRLGKALSDGVYSVHVWRLNTFQCLPTLMDEDITTCRRTHHISRRKLWIWLLIFRLEGSGRSCSVLGVWNAQMFGFGLHFFFVSVKWTHCHFSC